ncbi:MAG TPA: glycoside hydrolase family 15 protein [Solirubrobacterales bacterium]|nr:glycoside hydrolase family 15 protein [Solirubrobacterales bacterium]
MGWARAALALGAVVAAGVLLVSGGSGADPRTPAGVPGLPPPFLGTAVVGDGRLTAAIDAYGDVVDLRVRPGGRALIDNPSARQAAGTVPSDTGIVPWVSLGGRPARPLWTADSVTQHYRRGTNVVVTTARFGVARVRISYAAGDSLACLTEAPQGVRISLRSSEAAAVRWLRCDDRAAGSTIRAAERDDRRWLKRSQPLGGGAPAWAERMYQRSLLTLRALTNPRSGASVAGARDGWAYIWPRDAATAALAFNAAGHQREAQEIVDFLLHLKLNAAARFIGHGQPVPGRGPQGDALGWVAVAARAVGRSGGGLAGPSQQLSAETSPGSPPSLPDYQEKASGNYLGNAIASADGPKMALYRSKSSRRRREGAIAAEFGTHEGLVRIAGEPGSGLDSAAAWAVEPFGLRGLYPQARRTMLRLVRRRGRFGITPGEAWPGDDPWTAPTAWTAWSLAALGERRPALRLLADLRRAATPAGDLPERVDAQTGVPRSTTPLAWTHAFAILTLLELWPPEG